MSANENIIQAIKQGVEYLGSQQQSDGSFLDYASGNQAFKNISQRHTVFSTSLILSCLCSLEPTEGLDQIKQKAANFLLSQKGNHWSFNYWARESQEAQKTPYPDDLDDTCCALAALASHDKTLIDGAVLAEVAKLLTMLEVKEGGPYRTWLVPATAKKAWKDIDLAVNSNIVYLLSLFEVTLPNVNLFIERKISNREISSPYYATPFPVAYFIARCYQGPMTGRLRDHLLTKRTQDDNWGNPLDTALATMALLNMGYPAVDLQSAINYLLKHCNKDRWEPYPLIIESSIEGKITYAGSPALTVAFALEAINKYRYMSNRNTASKNSHSFDDLSLVKQQVMKNIGERFTALGSSIEKTGQGILSKVTDKDASNHKILLPYHFAKALDMQIDNDIKKLLIKLGEANLYGWIAYTIYDDFLDEEGDPLYLSLANICLRELTVIYKDLLPSESGIFRIYCNFMDEVDTANHWEVKNCRATVGQDVITLPKKLPNYSNNTQLSGKSIGQALGPLAVLLYAGHKSESPEVSDTVDWIRHYLTARQLSDDMHDWEEDLKKGYLTSATTPLINKWRRDEQSKPNTIHIKNDWPELQRIFWHQVANQLCNEIITHSLQVQEHILSSTIIKHPDMLQKLVDPVEKMAKNTLQERQRVLEFLSNY